MKKNNIKKYGAVSLYVVIFSILIITIITVGFIAIMVANQKQSTNNDLSQSAYDSALVGVEDGKRAILRYVNCSTDNSISGSPDCVSIRSIMDNYSSQDCKNIVNNLDGVDINSDGEVIIKSGATNNFEQAYTCVKVTYNTSEYKGILERNESKLIPLVGENNFSEIKIDWFMPSDLSSGTQASIPLLASGNKLFSSWKSASSLDYPSIMRTQLVQHNNSGFMLSDFTKNDNNNYSNTLFLYPTTITSATYNFSGDARMQPDDTFKNAACKADFTNGGYACSAKVLLPDAVGAKVSNTYLNLTALYSKTNYQIQLLDDSGNVVNFFGVQPEIDSTGRANDLFRRVKSRVEIVGDQNLLPKAAVEITDTASDAKFCKDYIFYSSEIPDNNCN